jgi:uncharacterized protein YndB with AHSA1/START domain
MSTPISIETDVQAPVSKVWRFWTDPTHITRWNTAMDDWHSPSAENDLREGGRFSVRMEAKDGSMGFDFGGTYDEVIQETRIACTMDDGRKVSVDFSSDGAATHILEEFEPENENPRDMQQQGWQNILNNFKNYAESAS